MKFTLTLFTLIWLLPILGFAQTKQLRLDPAFAPQISITGTSSLHDWKVVGSGILEVPQNLEMQLKTAPGIAAFGFKVPVDSLDGGRGAAMNAKIYGAFKSGENPYITYHQTAPATVTMTSDHMEIVSTGNLSMAGVEKPISVALTGVSADGKITFKGTQDLKMSEYSMDPPTAMFGQIKTHNDVVVHFEFRYNVIDE